MNFAAVTIITDADITFWLAFIGFAFVGMLIGRAIGGKSGFVVALAVWIAGSIGTIVLQDKIERGEFGGSVPVVPAAVEPVAPVAATPQPGAWMWQDDRRPLDPPARARY